MNFSFVLTHPIICMLKNHTLVSLPQDEWPWNVLELDDCGLWRGNPFSPLTINAYKVTPCSLVGVPHSLDCWFWGRVSPLLVSVNIPFAFIHLSLPVSFPKEKIWKRLVAEILHLGQSLLFLDCCHQPP